MTWLRRLFGKPHIQQSTRHAETIIEVARDMRADMMRATKESRSAQRDIRNQRLNIVEQQYLGRRP